METKKRLLISKWRGVQDRAKVERNMGDLIALVDRLNTLVGKLAAQDEEISTLTSNLAEATETIKELESEREERADELESALIDVRYWLHDGLVHGKIVSDPRSMLRKVEEVLQ